MTMRTVGGHLDPKSARRYLCATIKDTKINSSLRALLIPGDEGSTTGSVVMYIEIATSSSLPVGIVVTTEATQ